LRGPKDPNIANAVMKFSFVPDDLRERCRTLVKNYHTRYGHLCLPDMLWNSDARLLINSEKTLKEIFKYATHTRSSKKANDSLQIIATIVVAVEVLARDFAGWGTQFPNAKRQAEKLLGDIPLLPRVWLMDKYGYLSSDIHTEAIQILDRSRTSRF
jgi:hypothetical protein